jgi:thiol-disulfide isomerase/thioredoxin
MSNQRRSRQQTSGARNSQAGAKTGSSGKARPSASRRQPAPRRRQASSGLVIGGLVAVVVGAVVVVSIITSGGATGATEADAWDLPALSQTGDEDGDGRITLAEYRGTPVVVNFFASWCTSCEAELPRFDEALKRAEGQVEIVFVNSNETGNWRPMAERTGIDDRTLIKDINGNGGNGLYFNLGGSGGMPMTAFYDADGALVHVDRGELSFNALASRFEDFYGISI